LGEAVGGQRDRFSNVSIENGSLRVTEASIAIQVCCNVRRYLAEISPSISFLLNRVDRASHVVAVRR
jgi:hypothetical protein